MYIALSIYFGLGILLFLAVLNKLHPDNVFEGVFLLVMASLLWPIFIAQGIYRGFTEEIE
jgi:hypothetical protein